MEIIVKHIIENKPMVYAKYGDGELYAAINRPGGNCDRTPYTPELGLGIIRSFKYLTNQPTAYIGKRQEEQVVKYFTSIASAPIQWMDYGLFLFDSVPSFIEKEGLYKVIRNATQQKIYVCNEMMVERSKLLLKIDTHVVIDKSNWFQKGYASVLEKVVMGVSDPNSVLILLSAGMGAKVLIADLHAKFPNAIIVDIGSALDLVCALRVSRDYHQGFTLKDVQEIYRRLLA